MPLDWRQQPHENRRACADPGCWALMQPLSTCRPGSCPSRFSLGALLASLTGGGGEINKEINKGQVGRGRFLPAPEPSRPSSRSLNQADADSKATSQFPQFPTMLPPPPMSAFPKSFGSVWGCCWPADQDSRGGWIPRKGGGGEQTGSAESFTSGRSAAGSAQAARASLKDRELAQKEATERPRR